MSTQKEIYEKEKNLIVETEKQKEIEKQKARIRHEELIKKLDEEYNLELEKLKKDKQKELSELAEKYQDDQEELAKKIAEALGAEYVPAGEE